MSMRTIAALLATLSGAFAIAGIDPRKAGGSHPCYVPEFEMKLLGRAYVGERSTFTYHGEEILRIKWGDGTTSRPRQPFGPKIRHRFRRPGRLTVRVEQFYFDCCHGDECGQDTSESVWQSIKVRVRDRH